MASNSSISAMVSLLCPLQLAGDISVFHILDTTRPQDTGIARRTPFALGSLRQEIIYDPGPSLPKIIEKVPVGLQSRHSRQRWEPGGGGVCCLLLLQGRIWPDTGGN